MISFGLFNYIASLLLILFGLFAMMTENNFIRKIIGMVILQTGVILFFVSVSYKEGSKIPIIPEGLRHAAFNPDVLANPLPHALMLTAIVVGVSTLGVALVLAISVFRNYKTIEEDEILSILNGKSDE